MLSLCALAVVMAVGTYLVSLAALALRRPEEASRFLLGFASSARLHYAELALRILAGGAFVVRAPDMLGAEGFRVFGWVLLITSAVLLGMPWRWHRHFAARAVPHALRMPSVLVIGSMALGLAVLVGAVAPLLVPALAAPAM